MLVRTFQLQYMFAKLLELVGVFAEGLLLTSSSEATVACNCSVN